jgi:hypothetical protein
VRPGDAAVKHRFLRFRAPYPGGGCNLRLVGFCFLPGFCSALAPGYVIEIRVIRVIRGLAFGNLLLGDSGAVRVIRLMSAYPAM